VAIPLEVVLDRPGRTPLRLTPLGNSISWSTAAVGGFGDCAVGLPGPPPLWKREIPFLSTLRIILDTQVIYEGLVEDVSLQIKDENSTVKAFGLQRNLQRTTVRRIWSKRDLNLLRYGGGIGGVIPFSGSGSIAQQNLDLSIDTGSVSIAGNGVAVSNLGGCFARAYYPGATITYVFGTATITGANTGVGKMIGRLFAYDQGGSTIRTSDLSATTDFTWTPTEPHEAIGFGFFNNSGANLTPFSGDTIVYSKLRLLGTSLLENGFTGGFYGGSILRDLIPLVPGLTIGVIDDGSDFAIQSIERNARDTALSVVNEVSGYYTREWGVWENGRFDWKTVNKDEPQWIATVADLASGSELDTTVDGLAQTLFVTYTDAASNLDMEASASSTSQPNPFVKQGMTSDVINSPGFPMTSLTASQLASRIVSDENNYPSVSGRLIIPAMNLIKQASGTPLPAYMIRAGQNLVVSDLPKTDLFAQGRDGETLFHIVSTNANLEQGQVVLEVEGQTKRSDVLLARLAAVTRTLTG
jgi:hypothetical protein